MHRCRTRGSARTLAPDVLSGRPQCCSPTLTNVCEAMCCRRLAGGSVCPRSPVPQLITGTLLQACIKAPQDMAPAIVEELQNLSPCTQPQIEQEKLQVLVSGQFAVAEMPRKQLQDRVGGNRFEITTTLQEAVKQQEEAEMHLNMMRWLQGASCTDLLHPWWYVQPRAHHGMVLAPHEPGGCVGAHCMCRRHTRCSSASPQ